MKAVAAQVVLAAALAATGAAVDPNDAVLVMYSLTDAQKAQFSTSDGKVSGFWAADWTGRDYIDMNTTNNSYPGFDTWSGADDAHFTMKAAADKSGVYFLMEVTDNTWVDPVTGDGAWQYDAVDLYFDNKSSEAIKSGGDEILVNPAYGWALSFTSQQVKVWMGATALPTTFRYSYYDELYWDWSRNEVEFATAASTYNGMSMEVVKVDDTHKTQEWFIPWSQLGVGGVSGEVAAGKRFAFAGGYNDMDGEDGTVKQLRWKLYDPFAGAENGLASWGDIEAEASIATAIAPSSRHVSRPAQARSPRVDRDAAYGLRGERLGSAAKRAAGLFSVSAGGTVHVGRLMSGAR